MVLTTLLGAIGTFVAAIFGKPVWEIPLIVFALFLAISLPSMFLAYMKLRKRNLSPILDANGWAINNVAKMNVPFGRSLTDMPMLPPGSQRSLVDPFAEKKEPWLLYTVLVVAVVLAAGAYFFVWPKEKQLVDQYWPTPDYDTGAHPAKAKK